MLRSNSKSLGNHVVSPEEEKERLRWEGFAEIDMGSVCWTQSDPTRFRNNPSQHFSTWTRSDVTFWWGPLIYPLKPPAFHLLSPSPPLHLLMMMTRRMRITEITVDHYSQSNDRVCSSDHSRPADNHFTSVSVDRLPSSSYVEPIHRLKWRHRIYGRHFVGITWRDVWS